MYLDPAVLTAGALRLLQLLLNPFITAGLQSVAYPNNGLPYNAMAVAPVVATSPPRQLSASAALLSALGLVGPGAPGNAFPMGAQGGMAMPTMPTMSSMPTMGPMPPMGSMNSMGSVQPIPPWLLSQPLPAVPSTPTGPLFVPSTVVSGLVAQQQQQQQGGLTQYGQPVAAQSGASPEAMAALEQAIAPYTNGSPSSSGASSSAVASSTGVSETASPMPMGSLIALFGNILSGFRVVIVNFAASVAVMVGARLVRVVVQNLPIILNLLGLTRAGMARVIVDGVTRAQCLERAACLMGRHASSYPGTPDVLRWLRSPNPSAPEHPVWKAFRAAAEGAPGLGQCDVFTC